MPLPKDKNGIPHEAGSAPYKAEGGGPELKTVSIY